MSGATAGSPVGAAEDASEGLTLSDLIVRFGEASGTELFQRLDTQQRRGNRILGTTVRAARGSFNAAQTPGRAQLVIPRRGTGAKADKTAEAADHILMIAFSDLEAVVKANQPKFNWAAEFAPRPDLPTPDTAIVIHPGAPARATLKL
jgi:hypothetical protein